MIEGSKLRSYQYFSRRRRCLKSVKIGQRSGRLQVNFGNGNSLKIIPVERPAEIATIYSLTNTLIAEHFQTIQSVKILVENKPDRLN